MRKVMIGNHAASYAVLRSRVQLISAYPITPQTQIVELLSEFCGNGTLKAQFIKVESEHSALASLIGAASAGARTFTATSSQGLALMHELLHWASGARLPIVMVDVNRSLAPAWSIWADQSDTLSQRDTGWVQIYCETGQEIFDLTVIAYRLAEAAMLPVMIAYDAFYLSHTSEPVDIADQGDVDDFLPPYRPEIFLDVDNPVALGNMATPKYYMEMRYHLQQAMDKVPDLFNIISGEFSGIFGRLYGILEGYKADDAETVVICASTIAGTVRIIVDAMREKGIKIGLLKLRMFRPFPNREIAGALKGKKLAVVIDRNLSPGMGGIFAQEIKSSLYGIMDAPRVMGVVTGLGGRDITPALVQKIINDAMTYTGPDKPIFWEGLDPKEEQK